MRVARPLTGYEVVRSMAVDMFAIQKFSRNPAVGTSQEDIWHFGGIWPGHVETTPRVMRVAAGGSAADSPGGAGAGSVTVFGYDDNLDIVSDTLVTAGASAGPAGTVPMMFPWRASAGDVGTGRRPAGTISVESADGVTGALIGAIDPFGQSAVSFFVVPRGHVLAFKRYQLDIKGNNGGLAAIYQRRDILSQTPPMPSERAFTVDAAGEGQHGQDFGDNPLLFPPGTLLFARGVSSTGSSEIAVQYTAECWRIQAGRLDELLARLERSQLGG